MSLLKKLFIMVPLAIVYSDPVSNNENFESCLQESSISISKAFVRERTLDGLFITVGDKDLNRQDLFSKLNSNTRSCNSACVEEDIKLLEDLYHGSVDISVEEIDDVEGIVFSVDREGFVSDLVVTGSESALLHLVKDKANVLVDRWVLRSKVEKFVKEMLEEAAKLGHYSAIIKHNIYLKEDGTFCIDIDVNSNMQFEIQNIKFTNGITQNEFNEMRGSLILKKKHFLSQITDGSSTVTFNLADASQNVSVIEEFYRAMGFRDVSVKVMISEKDKCIAFHVDKGIKYFIKRVEITGNTSISDDEILKVCHTLENASVPFSDECVALLSKRISQPYHRIGKTDVSVSIEIKDIINGAVELRCNVSEGGIFSLGMINVSGNDRTSLELILADLNIYTGGPIDLIKIERSIYKMKARGLYKDVFYYLSDSDIEGAKDITLVVKENRAFNLTASLEVIRDRTLKISTSVKNLASPLSVVKRLAGSYGYEILKGEDITATCNLSLGFGLAGWKFWSATSLDFAIVQKMINGSDFSWMLESALYRAATIGYYSWVENKVEPGIFWTYIGSANILRVALRLEAMHINTSIDLGSRDLLDYRQTNLHKGLNKFTDDVFGISGTIDFSGLYIKISSKYCKATDTCYSAVQIEKTWIYGAGLGVLFRVKASVNSFIHIKTSNETLLSANAAIDGVPLTDNIVIGPAPANLILRGLAYSSTLGYRVDGNNNTRFVLPKSAAVLSVDLLFMPDKPMSPVIFVDLVLSSHEMMFASVYKYGISSLMAGEHKDKHSLIMSMGVVLEVQSGGMPIQFGFAKVFNAISPDTINDMIISVSASAM